ncbi:rhodanese-like domain [Chlorella sorokiniana]|uniref:Rhodanese-like domain n=1 Tax=Chlorella sorokiniana TaxID=3076 RepID=A0A2P6U1J1_CHLSO|nr:rhodanese-like domain [Chlorella sorokiniana]|eukprot:PRW60175.1 rhodanese-like domain [Chlorella sorokiniana]
MGKKIRGHFPDVPIINCTELKRMLDDPLLAQTVVVLDTRGPAETDVSMIPGSLTTQEFEARRDEFAGRTVVTYCTIGYRSCRYAQQLRQQGLEAKNLEGSIVRWCQKRYPIVTRSKGSDGSTVETETKRVHTYDKAWALQPDDYEAVIFRRPFLAGVRGLLPSWLGGFRKKQAS